MPIVIDGSGTIAGISPGGLPDSSITTDEIADAAVTSAKLSAPFTRGLVQPTTSGTSVDFNSLPSWVRQITIMFNGVSTSGSSNLIVQVGTSAGLVTTGYLGVAKLTNSASGVSFTTAFGICEANAATAVYYGSGVLTNIASNTWIWTCNVGRSDTPLTYQGNGGIALSGTLDRIRFTTANGTDLFDAGSVNILYEG